MVNVAKPDPPGFTPREDALFHQLDEPFRSRALLAAYRLRNLLAGDNTVKLVIEDAWRDHTEQERLYRIGRRYDPGRKLWVDKQDPNDPAVTWAVPGKSAHNYRRAIHLVLKDATTRHWLPPNETSRRLDKRWLLVGQAVNSVNGLIWGGDWAKRDYAHLECADWKKIAQARAWIGLGEKERAEG